MHSASFAVFKYFNVCRIIIILTFCERLSFSLLLMTRARAKLMLMDDRAGETL